MKSNMSIKLHTLTSEHRYSDVRRIILSVLFGSILLAMAAHIQVPFWPVKLSMQSFVVLAIGFCYGSRLGAATVLTYIAQGCLGLPVFQSGAGFAYLLGPTGGYLAGFVLAAAFMGLVSERFQLRTTTGAAVAVLGAMAVIYVPGLIWLSVLFGTENALPFGLMPFIPGDLLKTALAVAVIRVIRR